MSAQVSPNTWGAWCAECCWGTDDDLSEQAAEEAAREHDKQEHAR